MSTNPSPSWSTSNLGTIVPGDPAVHLHYLDSHPSPPPVPYTTVIAVHGTGFNSRIWLPLLPHLPPNLRLLAFNRRGHAGSSAVHESKEQTSGNVEAFGRYVLDLVGFLRFAVEQLGVPATDEAEEGKGGIVLLGWSKGCASIIGLRSWLSTGPSPLPPPVLLDPYLPLLRSHLRATVLFEPVQTIFALPGPGIAGPGPGLKDVFREELNATFGATLFETVPEGKRAVVGEAEDSMDALWDDVKTWNGSSSAEMREVCERAVDGKAGVKMATMYCEGTTLEVLTNGAKWVNERCKGAPGFWPGVITGGDHFLMATDPQAFAGALEEAMKAVGVAC